MCTWFLTMDNRHGEQHENKDRYVRLKYPIQIVKPLQQHQILVENKVVANWLNRFTEATWKRKAGRIKHSVNATANLDRVQEKRTTKRKR